MWIILEVNEVRLKADWELKYNQRVLRPFTLKSHNIVAEN